MFTKRLRRLGLAALTVVLAATSLTLMSAGGPARASAAPVLWGPAQQVPGMAALTGGDTSEILSMSCASAGNCAAGGLYDDTSHHLQAFVVNESNGAWGSALPVPGLAALNVGNAAMVQSVSCATAGNCTAGGTYEDAGSSSQAFVVTEANGTWGTAQEVPGTAALNAGGVAEVQSMSCPDAQSCGATGYYTDANGIQQAFAVNRAGGAWGTAQEIPGTAALNAGGESDAVSVSCAVAGSCAAVGHYTDAAGNTQPYLVTSAGGTWAAAQPVPGMADLNKGGYAPFSSVACATAGNCVAGGSYSDAAFRQQAFTVSLAGGVLGTAQEVPGTAALNVSGSAGVTSVACPAAGGCAEAGWYFDGTGHNQPFTVTQSGGAWGTAKPVPGMLALQAGANSNLTTISCSTPGNCGAGGTYADAAGHAQAFLVTEANGTWGAAQAIPALSQLNANGLAGVQAISCPADGTCAAGGMYDSAASRLTAFTADAPTVGLGGITGPGGKCVDDGGGGNGAQVVLKTCNGSAGQAWTPQSYGAVMAQGKCLTAGTSGGPAGAAGTRVQLWICKSLDRTQLWQVQGSQLFNAYTGLCLDAGSSTADGTPLQVWTCNGTTAQNWTLPTGSSLPTSNPDQGYDVAYQGTDGHLGYVKPDGTVKQTSSVVAAGTSPAIAGRPGNAWVSAFTGSNGSLWIGDAGGNGVAVGPSVPAGASPSVAAELTGPRTGPWMADVPGPSGQDYTYSTGTNATGVLTGTPGRVLAGTSPSITSTGSDGVFEEAFADASSGKLWVQQFEIGVGSSSGRLVGGGVSLAPATSPAIAAGLGPGIGSAWEIAFHGSDGHLQTVDAFGNHVTYPYLLTPGSGVAITALPTTGQYVVVFQAATDGLVYKKATGNGWLVPDGPVSLVGGGIGMAPNTHPAIALGNAGYGIAVHGTGDTVLLAGSDNTTRDTGQAIAAGTSPAIAGSTGGTPAAPELSPPIATASSVTISWNDQSTNEYQFVLQKRVTGDGDNGWADIYTTQSDNPAGIIGADEYSYTDVDTGPDAECYRVLATPVVTVGGALPGISGERCTVRPDPAKFPQSVPLSAEQWNNFSASPLLPAVNGAPADDLANIARTSNQELVNRDQTWGVNLDWDSGGSCWIFRGRGSGDQLLTGQALAIETCDSHGNGTGQYLAYGGQTFGVDVTLLDYPSYEWHVIGDSSFADNAATGPARPGFGLAGGGYRALYDDQNHKYLVTGSQTFGVDLDWFDPSAPPPGGGITQPPPAESGVGVLRVFNCDPAGHPVTVWARDTTTTPAGSYQKIGGLAFQTDPATGCVAKDAQPLYFTPAPQRQYQVTVTDPLQAGCTSDDPANPACVEESKAITGNPAGAIETTTVGVGTDRSPFAANGLK
jgi:ricin-type beta-trefoil lectin protein